MNKVRAVHIASFNGNIGDNANHNGFRRRLEESLKRDVEYIEIEMREFYQSWGIRDFNSDEFINVCNSNDLVIIGGGNFFELKWDYSYTGTTVNISHETLEKIKTPIFFHGVGCDIAKGVNENTINKFDSFLDKVANSDKYLVSVRNDGSYDTIHQLYGEKYMNKIHRIPDGAFFLKTKENYFPELSTKLKSVGINVVSDMKDIRFGNKEKNQIDYDEFIKQFGETINTFLNENKDYQVIFFPHIYSDLLATYEVIEMIKDINRRTRVVVAPCLTGKFSDEYIFGLYKECEFILGMRFHSNVCSIAQEIPTIALSSYKKIDDLYLELDLSDRVIHVNKSGFEEKLKVQIKDTIVEKSKIKERYKDVNKNIDNVANDFYERLRLWSVKNNII